MQAHECRCRVSVCVSERANERTTCGYLFIKIYPFHFTKKQFTFGVSYWSIYIPFIFITNRYDFADDGRSKWKARPPGHSLCISIEKLSN